MRHRKTSKYKIKVAAFLSVVVEAGALITFRSMLEKMYTINLEKLIVTQSSHYQVNPKD